MSIIDPPVKQSTGTDRSLELLALARAGDGCARDRLVRELMPFVLRCAARAAGRYVRRGEDDEVSIALIAFNEAIDSYDEQRPSGFFRFADMVIRRRLIDHYRKERAREPMVSLNDGEGDADRLMKEVQHPAEIMEYRDELERFSRLLGEYGLTISEVSRSCPHHRDARSRAQSVARLIVASERLRDHLVCHKTLPGGLIARMAGMSRRTIDRNRAYITAVCLILLGEFPLMSEYVYGS